MRTETQTIYRFSELDEDARATAVDNYRADIYLESDELADVMAEQLGYSLGHHDGGLGEPLRGIKLGEWSIDRNGRDHLAIEGVLRPEDSRVLPWPEDAGHGRIGTVVCRDYGLERGLWGWEFDELLDPSREDVQAFWDALDEIIAKALAAGCAEYDHLCSEEHAREMLEINDPESFDEEGRWV